MSRTPAAIGFDSVEQLRIIINNDAFNIGKQAPVFREVYSLPKNFTCFEAGFLRMTSWLYMLYYEAGKGELEFAIEKFNIYSIENTTISKNHYKDLRVLRTTFQHSLDLDLSRNAQYKTITENWFNRAIYKKHPTAADDWQNCLELIVKDALVFLTNISEVIQKISKDEFVKSIIDDWNFKSSRIHQHHDFDSLIYTAAHEFGMQYLDTIKFRKKNAETWIQELQNLTGNYDFNIEARKLIERDMIKKPLLPITGQDIMDAFDIPPGPKIKIIMETALSIFAQKPCSKEELINKIKPYILS